MRTTVSEMTSEAANRYLSRGWMPVPIPYRDKGPVLPGWPQLRLTETDLPWYFNEQAQNIGVLLGDPSGGLVDIDLDCTETLRLATRFLPSTALVFGRESKRRSHWLYVAVPSVRTERFTDPLGPGTGGVLVELRSTGAQTIFPPSIHPEGESITFDVEGVPAEVDGKDLRCHVARLAAAALLARYWPSPDSHIRQDTSLALAGGLLRAGWGVQDAEEFIRAVAYTASDEEADNRADTAVYTARKLEQDMPTTGWLRLAELLGPHGHVMIRKIMEWLDIVDSCNRTPYRTTAVAGNTAIGASQATRLVGLATDAELFHTPDHQAYGTVPVGEHRETYLLKGEGFRRWLARRYYETEGTAPGGQALQEALTVLDGKARFDGPEHAVFVRLAEDVGTYYLDLGDPEWRAVRITPAGWEIVTDPPVKFRRPKGMAPLPLPKPGGRLEELRPFVNVKDADWPLVVAWLAAALRPRGPYPILALHGEQGSAKSTTARVLRALVDPSTAPLRAEPHGERDLMITATNNLVITLDNLSRIQPWLSDALCRLATGGGFATRELYSDAEETILEAQRPVILNGIEELGSRSDLLDRSLIVYLPEITPAKRRPEAAFWQEFESVQPAILGALLDMSCGALESVASVEVAELPRLADFVVWAIAAERALNWPAGTFWTSYAENRESANALALEASPLVIAIQELVVDSKWDGPANRLLQSLEEHARSDGAYHQPNWPRSPSALSRALRRLAPNLRMAGINVSFPTGRKHGRRIVLEQHMEARSEASSVSLLSPEMEASTPELTS